MASYTTHSLAAAATGIVGSIWTSGAIASLSVIGIPAARDIPESSAVIWQGLFTHGMNTMPKMAVVTALSYCYAAYSTRGNSASKNYLASASFVVSIIPFTILFMSSTNRALLAAAEGVSSPSSSQVSELIGKWGYLNLTRSLLPLTGGLLAFLTLYHGA